MRMSGFGGMKGILPWSWRGLERPLFMGQTKRRIFAEVIVDYMDHSPPGTSVMIASATKGESKELLRELKAVCREWHLLQPRKRGKR